MGWLALLGWLVAALCAWRWYVAAHQAPQFITDTRVETQTVRVPVPSPIDPRQYTPRERVMRLLQRARRLRTAREPDLSSVPERSVVLLNTRGEVESVRACRGTPPKEILRPHGRERATVYTPIGQDGDRYLYRANA